MYINTISHGGAERVIVNLANQFAQNKNEVILINSYESDWEYEYDQRIRRIVILKNKTLGLFKKNFLLVKRLRKIFKYEKPNVIISFMAEPNFRTIISSRGLDAKVIVSVRNDPSKEYPNIATKVLANILYRKADGVVFQTLEAQRYFNKNIQKKSKIIYNQVDKKFFNIEQRFPKKNIITVGRLTEQKNHELLIKAFAKIKNQTEENLVIYGDGKKKKELFELVNALGLNERVFLPGVINNIETVLSEAKLFVLSSDYEGMPNALLEAMAAGLPCISTDCPCGGPRELFKEGENGILTELGNVAEMSEKILLLLNNEEKACSLSKNALQAAKQFNPDAVFRIWNDYISGML